MFIVSLVETYFHVGNILISVCILFFGLLFLHRLKFSLQKKAIFFFLIGIILFTITEVLILANVSWRSELIEILEDVVKSSFIVCFGITLFFFRQSEQYEISKLHRRAFRDILTGLYNYAFFRQSGQQKFLEAKRRKLPLSVMMLDIDNFKAYNDQFGHQSGNTALQCFAKELKHITREYDLVARYGGEEFVVLISADLDEGFNLAQRICNRIASACNPQSHPELYRSITVSIGLASITESINSLDKLIEAADLELYRAKQAGKNRVHVINEVPNSSS
ncbi:GGDEF domain-containing protein [Waterburya agarophytonicola K14]|uniref:GGDEF domain-containing protein n=1 Tax=Waterburya agarophytonicola KI4 TaxID=2874699 RepID=A0A964BLG2_9CYAN|nr:GGDEF domain-containing protein [Waterburya agarophytonicola]MCC0175564.1 GGDEF domain-containing protein [Waterburya agarophytonicola KI4]